MPVKHVDEGELFLYPSLCWAWERSGGEGRNSCFKPLLCFPYSVPALCPPTQFTVAQVCAELLAVESLVANSELLDWGVRWAVLLQPQHSLQMPSPEAYNPSAVTLGTAVLWKGSHSASML